MNDFGISPLLPLCGLQHPVADLVKTFLDQRHGWKVDDFFLRRTRAYFEDQNLSDATPFALEGLDPDSATLSTSNVRLNSVRANYFRGFRKHACTIDMSADLVVLEGLNSSGKTSLAEAIEWALTGEISRRQTGDPTELSELLANKFRPDDEETWVEFTVSHDGEIKTFKRLLLKDYDAKKHSRCTSLFFVNGVEESDTSKTLNELYSGVAPLLMQHTLRQFVVDNPKDRRRYFERLFNLDDITNLISKAVVGDISLAHFKRNGGGEMQSKWTELREMCSDQDSSTRNRFATTEQTPTSDAVRGALRNTAIKAFAIECELCIESMVERVQELQRLSREGRFPHLENLRPKRLIDPKAVSQLSINTYTDSIESLRRAEEKFRSDSRSVKQLTAAQDIIARALRSLQEEDLLEIVEDQICPMCEYGTSNTLTVQRMKQISSWNVAQAIVSKADKELRHQIDSVSRQIRDLTSLRHGLIPDPPPEMDWDAVIRTEFKSTLLALRDAHLDASEFLKRFDELCIESDQASGDTNRQDQFMTKFSELVSELDGVRRHAQNYFEKFNAFESRLGELALNDDSYGARAHWLDLSGNIDNLVEDLRWHSAKEKAQMELELIRESLKTYRQTFLEERRQDVSNSINNVWSILREDYYSGYKAIEIPKPKGKGYQVRLEVKALLDDGRKQITADALNVLSESQINAIGIAAFISRSEQLHHRCMVFDDPVQSMDEEHLRSFASELLSHLCGLGIQIIILTHSESFARAISHYHFDRIGYVTYSVNFSQNSGVQITEGNRKVSERLRQAEKAAKKGDLDRAWYFVRLALERLYTITMLKHGPEGFCATRWENHTAADMWNKGVGEIFLKYAPGKENELKDILDMAVAGAHDKIAASTTDVLRAVKFIRPLMSKLRVGD